MKKIALVMGVLALSACGNEADAPAEEAATEEVAAAYAGGAGTYTRTTNEGESASTVITADGNFTSLINGEETANGTVTVDGETICFLVEASEEAEPVCWVNQPLRADGSFETTDPEGTTYIIQMTAAEAE